MNTLILLLALTNPGINVLPDVPPLPETPTAKELENMEKFKRDKARREATEAMVAASRGEMQREIAAREAKKLADRRGAMLVSSGKVAISHSYVSVKERAKILYDKHHPKKLVGR